MTPVHANGTHAKEIALHFLDTTTDGRNTPYVIAKTIRQAKNLLNTGYSRDEIIGTIDYMLKRGAKMYSFGYINASIGQVIQDVQRELNKENTQQEIHRLEELTKSQQSEVSGHDESSERNRAKFSQFGLRDRENKWQGIFGDKDK